VDDAGNFVHLARFQIKPLQLDGGQLSEAIRVLTGMPINPDNDPNEAYEIGYMPPEPHGMPADWLTVFCNGIPVHHFTPDRRASAERYCTDPAFRLSLERRYIHT
jgi:hypothetical protein